MQSDIGSPGLYEHIVTVSCLLFIKSMKLYSELGNRAANDPKIIKNAKIQKGLEQIIETMEACGNGLKRLPDPPLGAQAAHERFCELGKDIYFFAGSLREFSTSGKDTNPPKNVANFREQSNRVKQNFREAIVAFENVYPGRLSGNLQSQLQT